MTQYYTDLDESIRKVSILGVGNMEEISTPIKNNGLISTLQDIYEYSEKNGESVGKNTKSTLYKKTFTYDIPQKNSDEDVVLKDLVVLAFVTEKSIRFKNSSTCSN
jgi:hypothetical protein